MVHFSSAFVAAVAVGSVAALPAKRAPTTLAKRDVTPNSQGNNNGFFYQFWDDGQGGSVTYTNGDAGEFSVTWSDVSDFTSGKGWSNATDRSIAFDGSFDPSGNAYLAVYTWSEHGETYILENYGSYDPCSGGTQEGTLSSDGGSYTICRVDRGNGYIQYWSVRAEKRSSGTVTTKNHYDKYNSLGLPFDPSTNATYQIVSVEGFGSSGSAKITVSEASGSSSDAASSAVVSSAVAPASSAAASVPAYSAPASSAAAPTSVRGFSSAAPTSVPAFSSAPASSAAPNFSVSPASSSYPNNPPAYSPPIATAPYPTASGAASYSTAFPTGTSAPSASFPASPVQSSEPCEISVTYTPTPTPEPSDDCEVKYVYA